MVKDAIRFEQFTPPMRKMLTAFVEGGKAGLCRSARTSRASSMASRRKTRATSRTARTSRTRARVYLAGLGSALLSAACRSTPPVPMPVNSVLAGRRNNPPDEKAGIRALAVYNPIHYQELPELFMDFIASLTGKSPSTTGAGSEGALTKGPFNAHPARSTISTPRSFPILLTDYHGFTSAAGHIGRKYRVDHDISLLVPEVWSRMFIPEREPDYLIENGYLEKIEDFEHDGKTIEASRLGYRITESFVTTFFGRMFSAADTVFTEDMLRPELQSMEDFVDGLDNIIETQRTVALNYFKDGSIDVACPPLKALLHIMAYGEFEGKDHHRSGDPRALHPRGADRLGLVSGPPRCQGRTSTRRSGNATSPIWKPSSPSRTTRANSNACASRNASPRRRPPSSTSARPPTAPASSA